MRDSYGYWLREVGVDALRVDTAFYIPPAFFEDWLHSPDPSAPGLMAVARGMGRQDLLVFGEAFGIDKAYQSTQMRRIQAYQTPGRMNGMLNFPLYGSLQAVFAQGRPTAELAHRVKALGEVFGARQHRMPTFIDNHDVDRFLAGGSEEALRQSLLALFTLPGIPTIYYGTEQGFTEPARGHVRRRLRQRRTRPLRRTGPAVPAAGRPGAVAPRRARLQPRYAHPAARQRRWPRRAGLAH